MIAAFIFVVSVVFLLQFFVTYCRSLIAAYRQVDLSEDARDVAGIEDHIVHGDDFRRLLQLVWLCPETGDDKLEIGSVRRWPPGPSGSAKAAPTSPRWRWTAASPTTAT
jgi:hypothetical protein